MKTKIKKIILVMLLSVGLLGVQNISNVKAESYQLKMDVTLNTIDGADLDTAKLYLNTNSNKKFDASTDNTANGYTEKDLTVSGKNITFSMATATKTVYAVVLAKDTNGLQYIAGNTPQWSGERTGHWTTAGGSEHSASEGSTDINIFPSADSYRANSVQLSDLIIPPVMVASQEYTGLPIAGFNSVTDRVSIKADSPLNTIGAPIALWPVGTNGYGDGEEIGCHYRVILSNNINVGEAKVALSFINGYQGIVEVSFTITPKKATTESITARLDKESYEYTGSAINPTPTVQVEGKTLVKDTDYTIAYSNLTEVGKQTATITLNRNYTGSKEIPFTITPMNIKTEDITASLDKESYEYTGSAISPTPTVKVGEKTLVKDTDYTIEYSNLTEVGKQTATITLKGNYSGSATVAFEIIPMNVATSDIVANLDKEVYTYTGSAISPTPTVQVGGKTLVKDTDYTIEYSNLTEIGSQTATITLKGNYVGTKTVAYSISDQTTDGFLTAYLGGTSNPWKSVTADNYQTILNGDTPYVNLTNGQRALINAKLAPTSYPELLEDAEVQKFKTDYKDLLDKTEASKDDIDAINKALDELKELSGKDKLTNEETKLTSLLEASQFLKNNEDIISKEIVTLTDEAAIDKALTDYEELKTGKDLVNKDVIDKLKEKKSAIDFLKKHNDILSKKKDELTSDDLKAINEALKDYEDLGDGVKSFIDEGIKSSLIDLGDFAKESEFIKTYVSDEKGNIYTDIDADNYEQIISGKETWDKLTQVQKAAINKQLTDNGGKSYDELIKDAQGTQEQVNEFIKKYVTDTKGNVYKETTSSNYEQIISGKETWDKLTQVQKAAINKQLTDNGGKSYDELIKDAQGTQEQVNEFIKKYVTDTKGNVYNEVNSENYIQIHLGTEKDFGNWANLDQDLKDAINQSLKDQTGKTYDQLIAEVDVMVKGMEDFVNKYLVDSKDNLYKEATTSNYKQILSGKDDWAKLTKDQQKAINDLLVANGGKTYEDLLQLADKLSKEAEKTNNEATKTNDNTEIGMYVLLGLVSIGGIVFLDKKRKLVLKD